MLRERRVTPIRKPVPDSSLEHPLRPQQQAFVAWTRTIGLSEQTALTRRSALDHFIRWSHRHGVQDASEITRETLEAYQAQLFQLRKRNGRPLELSTQVARLNPLKAFCKWLVRTRQLALDPASDLVVP